MIQHNPASMTGTHCKPFRQNPAASAQAQQIALPFQNKAPDFHVPAPVQIKENRRFLSVCRGLDHPFTENL